MDIEICVEESHWKDKAPSIELRSLERVNQLFKLGQVEKPLLTAQIKSSDIKVISESVKQLEQIQRAHYRITGKIIAGYENKVVVDCGVLLRIGINDVATNHPFRLSFGDYVELEAGIFGLYYDDWEGLIRYTDSFEGKVKRVNVVHGTNDISLLLDVVEPGNGVVIHPPYKGELKPNPGWYYQFGKPRR